MQNPIVMFFPILGAANALMSVCRKAVVTKQVTFNFSNAVCHSYTQIVILIIFYLKYQQKGISISSKAHWLSAPLPKAALANNLIVHLRF